MILSKDLRHIWPSTPFEGTEFQVKVWNALKEIPRGRGPNLHRNCGSNPASEFCPCGSQCLRPEPIPAYRSMSQSGSERWRFGRLQRCRSENKTSYSLRSDIDSGCIKNRNRVLSRLNTLLSAWELNTRSCLPVTIATLIGLKN